MKKKLGFTLIELLTVISILGLISSIVLANIQNSREKARKAAAAQFHAQTQHVLGAETRSAWEFDEGTYDGQLATTILDSSGSNNNGSAAGSVYYDTDTFNGQGMSLYFPGSSGHGGSIQGSGFNNSIPNSNVTISAWIKPANISINGSVFTTGSNAFTAGVCNSFGVTVKAGGQIKGETATQRTISQSSLVNNVWQHVTTVYRSNGQAEVYINGVKNGTVADSGTSQCAAGLWGIGVRISDNSQLFQGYIDSVRVYNEALSYEKVEALYALEKQRMIAGIGR